MNIFTLRRFDRWAVNLICITPAIVLGVLYVIGQLGPDPIMTLERRTGDIALIFLVISLIFTPLRIVTGFNRGVKYRRITGLWSFYYAATHFLIFLGLDYGFDFPLAAQAIIQSQYIWFGLVALLILLTMAITSTDGWKVRLKKNWRRIHRFVYLASFLAIVHFGLTLKGNLLPIRGDEFWPLVGLIVWAVLMLIRVPPIRKLVSRQR